MKKMCGQYDIQGSAITVGVFDSVHLGHQRILKRLVEEANRRGLKSLVITFHPHPREVLNPEIKIPFITSLEHRLRLIRSYGVDDVAVIKFTRTFSKISPDDFIKNTLIKKFNAKVFIAGENFLFGRNKSGRMSFLKRANRFSEIEFVAIKPAWFKKDIISSTRIRRAIEKGRLAEASSMLGRPVSILGTVVKGRRIGRDIGFPTANINPHHEAIPPSGVYIVNAKINGKLYKGLLNIGRRPTFGKGLELAIELHILNFKKDIYGKDVEIIFKRKLREEKKFPSIEALQKQIQKDIQKVK